MESYLKKLERKLNLNLQSVALVPPETLDDCFHKLHIKDIPEVYVKHEEWMQTLIDTYIENMKEMVKWFLRENLCDECKKKIFGEKYAKI
ncbi:MAG: hypothetical protein DRP18_00810 [Candidatus Aenigmatarchaeota archaeon]|nr:MAG: hypothetical protein DRP18_00810 [Candidatus Aenigmarchaeota archaeon]